MSREERPSKQFAKRHEKKEHASIVNSSWSIAVISVDADISEYLDKKWEPFAVDNGKIYFRNKN